MPDGLKGVLRISIFEVGFVLLVSTGTPRVAAAQPQAPEESGDFSFEVEDLTEDPEALERELHVETTPVEGEAGAVRGTVRDAKSGDPLIGAYVEAVGTAYVAKTDFDGNYTLELPVGTHRIRIRADTNQPRMFDDVVVAKGETREISVELPPLQGAEQVVEVQAEANRESEGARLLQRRESAAARDIMSRDAITKSGSGSTASVAVRIVGATVMDGKYLFVRGLGHRYGNTLFDGARVPSPEPDIRTVPLDLFPSGALSAINVQKTFSADVPADFAGGSVQLESREIPDQFSLDLGASLGINTQTTFRPIVHAERFAGADAFGFGNLPRGLPDAFSTRYPIDAGTRNEAFQLAWTPADIERFGEALYTDTRVRTGRIGPPNGSGSATVGYGFSPHRGGKLGFVASATYRNRIQNYNERWKFYAVAEDDAGAFQLQPKTDYRGLRTVRNVQWSTVGLVKYEPKKRHKLSLSALYARDADDEARALEGMNAGEALYTTRLRYVMRSILTTRLGGVHEIAGTNGTTLDWFGSYAQARRDDPSVRDMVFQRPLQGGGYVLTQAPSNISLHLLDHTESGALNVTVPFKQWRQLQGKFKIGAWIEGKQRAFTGRRFQYVDNTGVAKPAGTGDLLTNDTIGAPGSDAPFILQETTTPYDSYRARQEIYATYATIDLPIVRWFKVSAGVRFEANRQYLESYDIFTQQVDPSTASRVRNNDFLPALALIFPVRSDMNVRLSGTKTVARPEFRELAPFLFSDFAGGITVQGRPGLRRATIWNADARWEWFPSAGEVVAASVFYKFFDDPIERTIRPGTSDLVSTFSNADFAYNVGAELEVRKNLEFVWSKLRDLSVGGNLAYVYSRVRLADNCNIADPNCTPEQALDVSTSRVRPLQGQAPWVINAYLDYENKHFGTHVRLLYNAVFRTLAFVGGNNLPDMYIDPVHQLDFVGQQRLYKGLNLQLQVQNMLDWPLRWRQGEENALNYQLYRGATISIGLSYGM